VRILIHSEENLIRFGSTNDDYQTKYRQIKTQTDLKTQTDQNSSLIGLKLKVSIEFKGREKPHKRENRIRETFFHSPMHSLLSGFYCMHNTKYEYTENTDRSKQ
jgi:hypothetical protein